MKPELTPHEQYTISQVKALLKQWPKSLIFDLDVSTKSVVVYKRDPAGTVAVTCATEVASFRKPTLFR